MHALSAAGATLSEAVRRGGFSAAVDVGRCCFCGLDQITHFVLSGVVQDRVLAVCCNMQV